MQLHICTGGKGGIGKTLISLCALDYFRANRQQTAIFDINPVNRSISSILPANRNRLPEGLGNDLIRWSFDNYLTIIQSTASEMYKASEFWDRVLEVVVEVNDLIDPIVFVDTNANPSNLVSKNSIYDIRSIFESLAHHHIRKIYIWYIWTIEAIVTDHNANSALFEIEEANDILLPVAEDIGLQVEMIHVLNPYVPPKKSSMYRNAISVFQLAFGKQNTVISIGEHRFHSLVSAQRVSDPLSFEELVDILRYIPGRVNPNETDLDDVFEILADCIILYNPHNKGAGSQHIKRPRNLFPIGVYDESIAGLIGKLALRGRIQDFKDISEMLKNVSPYVHSYLTNL